MLFKFWSEFWCKHLYNWIIYHFYTLNNEAKSAGAVEYTDCISAER